MLSDPSTISLDAVQVLVPMITSVYDLRLLLTLVSVGGTALGSPQDASALVKAALDYVVAVKLVLDACVYFKMALEHCESSKLLSHNEFLLLDRRAEKANTESADWVLDLKKHVHANSARINAHDKCLQTVVNGLHELHAVVQDNRAAIQAVGTRVVSLQEQFTTGRRIIAQLVEHINAQSDQIQRVQQRLADSECAIASVTRRFDAFQQREARVKRSKRIWGIIASIIGWVLPNVKELGDMIIEYNLGEVVKLLYDESDVAAFVAETVQADLLPAVEQQFFKFAIPTTEFETLLREEIVLQQPKILQECEQRQLVVSFDGGRGDAARELLLSLDAEETTLLRVLEQLRLKADGLQTETIEPRAVLAVVATSARDNQASHPTRQPLAGVERYAPSETKSPFASDNDVGEFLASKMAGASIVGEFDRVVRVELAESVDAFPYVEIVDQCQGDVDECELEFEMVEDEGHDLHACIQADVVREQEVAYTAVTWSAVEYACFLGYVDIVKFLVKEHCKALPTKTRVQLLKTAKERAASGA